MCDTLHEIHSHKSNITCLYKVIEDIHNFKKENITLIECYGSLKNLWDEQHTNITQMTKQ